MPILSKYLNKQYPILSVIYAVYAGGENTLICDETKEYLNSNLSGTPTARKLRDFIANELEKIRADKNVPRAPADWPQPTSAQWDAVLALLKVELQTPIAPWPMW